MTIEDDGVGQSITATSGHCAMKSPDENELGGQVTSADIIAAICDGFSTPHASVDQRAFVRMPWVTELVVWLYEETADEKDRTRLHVTTHDVSVGGLSFVTRRHVEPGTTLRTQFKALAGQPSLKAIVRHCVPVGGPFRRIGAEFTDSNG